MIGNTGMFSAMLTEESKTHIYKEYEKYLMAKEAAEKAGIRKHSKGKTKSNQDRPICLVEIGLFK